FTCSATIQGNTFHVGSQPIYLPGGAPKILNNFFSDDGQTAQEGLRLGRSGVVGNSSGAVVANNVFWGMTMSVMNTGVLIANNTLVGGNAAIPPNTYGLITNGGVTVVNNIVAFYATGVLSYDPMTAHHNLVYGNLVNYAFQAVPGAGDIQSDPRVANRAG